MSLLLLRGRAAIAPTATEVVSVDPTSGAATDTIRVYCTRLRSGVTLTVGGNAVTITGSRYGLWDAGQGYPYIEGAAPAHADGAVDVVVTDYHGSSTASSAFTYAGGGGGSSPASLTFWSDWRTNTGNELATLTDGGKWDDAHNGTNRVQIIANPGTLGFPASMVNIVEGRYRETVDAQSWQINVQNAWALPAVGGMLLKRFYLHMALIGNTTDDGITFHPIEPFEGACASEAEWQINSGDSTIYGTDKDTTFMMRFKTDVHQYRCPSLPKFEALRVEERHTREATNSWKHELRIYDSAGTLLRTDADFDCDGAAHGSAHGPLSDQTAGEKTVMGDTNCFTKQNINWQGGANNRGSDDENNNIIYWAGYAVAILDVADDVWIGAYPHADEA